MTTNEVRQPSSDCGSQEKTDQGGDSQQARHGITDLDIGTQT